MLPADTARAAILGVPLNPGKQPSPSGVVRAFEQMDARILANSAGALVVDTHSDLSGLSSPAANIMVWVMSGSQAGVYQNTGTSGSPSWTKRADLPYGVIKAINVGAGSANAIVATSAIPVPSADGAAMIILPIVAANDASPVTVAFNGGSALTIKSNTGNDIAIGGLQDGMIVLGFKSGNTFRLISDQVSSAIIAQAEAYALAAANSAGAAEAAAALAQQRYIRVHVIDTEGGDPETDYEADDEIDGVTLVAGMIVARATEGGDAEDGIYVVPASGAASRHSEFDDYDDLPGLAIRVVGGTDNANTEWRVTSGFGGTIDTDPVTIEPLAISGSGDKITFQDDAAFVAAPSPVGDAFLTLGRDEPGDGGGGIWVGTDTEPGSQPKLYHPGLTRWFRAGETEQSLLRFGAKVDGLLGQISANNAALTDARDWMLENAIADTVSNNSRPPRLIIPHGIYRYDADINWGMPYLDIEGQGGATLFFEGAVTTGVGTGRALIIAGHDGNDYVSGGYRGVKVRGLILEGGEDVQGGLYLENVHDSVIQLNCRSAGTGAFTRAFEVRFSISSEFHLRSSVNDGAFLGSSVPKTGLYVTARTGEDSLYTVNSLFMRGVYEGVETGISLDRASDCKFIGGTSEGNLVGIVVAAAAQRNVFDSVYMEANDNYDIYCEGHGNTFRDLLSYGLVEIEGFAALNRIVGGGYMQINIGSNAVDTRLDEPIYDIGNTEATISDGGTRTFGTAINAVTRARSTYAGT